MGILTALREVCAEIGRDQFVPNQRWIADMLHGMAVSHSTMLSQIGVALEEETDAGDPRRLIHTEKRLSRGLNSDRLDDLALRRRHLERIARFARRRDGEGTVIAVDYTDLSKPRANREHGMEGVGACWDGSEGETGTGYPVVQIQADMGDVQAPVLLHPFSYAETAKSSQTKLFLEQIAIAAPYVGKRAWWTSDRGFDNSVYLAGLDALDLRWICRLQHGIKSQRHLFVARDRHLDVERAAAETATQYRLEIPQSRKHERASGKKTLLLEIGARTVWLSDQKNRPRPLGQARTLIVIRGFGSVPTVLLVSEQLEGREAIVEAVRAYGRRWKCEEATRAMKDSRGWGVRLEDVRALTLRGIRRIALLVCILYSFLATLRDTGGTLVDLILRLAPSFGKVPPDPTYRLFRGLGELLRRSTRRRREPDRI